MTSFKQNEANRRNALRSTAPKTEAGKQVSLRNALVQGHKRARDDLFTQRNAYAASGLQLWCAANGYPPIES